jgi:hypothetical protein
MTQNEAIIRYLGKVTCAELDDIAQAIVCHRMTTASHLANLESYDVIGVFDIRGKPPICGIDCGTHSKGISYPSGKRCGCFGPDETHFLDYACDLSIKSSSGIAERK